MTCAIPSCYAPPQHGYSLCVMHQYAISTGTNTELISQAFLETIRVAGAELAGLAGQPIRAWRPGAGMPGLQALQVIAALCADPEREKEQS